MLINNPSTDKYRKHVHDIITLISALVFAGLCGWRWAVVPPTRASYVITATGAYARTSSSPRPQTRQRASGSESWTQHGRASQLRLEWPPEGRWLQKDFSARGLKNVSGLWDFKHFSDKFMSSVTYFWSYGIKHKVSFGNCAHSKSQKDWLSSACLLALDSQVLSQWTRSFTVKPVGDVMAASSVCNPAADTRVTLQPQIGTKITFKISSNDN